MLDTMIGIYISSLIQGTGQGLRFENVTTGIDMTSGGSGMFNLIDSTAVNTSVLVNTTAANSTQGSLVLENVMVDASVPAVRALCSV